MSPDRHPRTHAADARAARRVKRSGRLGFITALLGYLVLSLAQPPVWTVPVWGVLAFLVVPGLSGFVAGRVQQAAVETRASFRAGMVACGGAMALYTGIELIVLRRRLEEPGSAAQAFLLWLVVTVVYALLAGSVAGYVCARTARSGRKGKGHEPAHR